MARINRRPSANRRSAIVGKAAPAAPPFQVGGHMDPDAWKYDPATGGYHDLPDWMAPGKGPDFAPGTEPPMGHPPSFAPDPEPFTPEPAEKYPYLPGEDYFAFTRRMDKVLGRGAMDVPKPGDPDFTPTMIDMWAKLPEEDRFRGSAGADSGIMVPDRGIL
jgi:hypothetical protein